MKLTLKIWRQDGPTAKGRFETYEMPAVVPDMSFLEMIDVLNCHCRPDSVTNAFTTLMSLFNDVQGEAESIIEFRSRFDGLNLELSRCKVFLPPILLVVLFLRALHRPVPYSVQAN